MTLVPAMNVKKNSLGMKGVLGVLDVSAANVLTSKAMLIPVMTVKNNSVNTERRINALKKNGIFHEQ
jgi:hypothetical protein